MFEFPDNFFKDAILHLRRRLGGVDSNGSPRISQAEMAKRIGCDLGTYQDWEAGRRNPRGEDFVRLLKLCPDDEALGRFGVECPGRRRLQGLLGVQGDEGVEDMVDAIEGLTTLHERSVAGDKGAREAFEEIARKISIALGPKR